HCALENLVFMRQQYAPAQPIHAAVIESVAAEIELGIYHCALPLTNIAFALLGEGLGERLEQFGSGALVTSTKRNSDCKFPARRQIDFAGQRDIPVRSCSKLPVHLEIVHQILPAIAEADVTDRAPGEPTAACHEQMNAVALCVHQFVITDFRT